jgi:hypothetical protein
MLAESQTKPTQSRLSHPKIMKIHHSVLVAGSIFTLCLQQTIDQLL